MSINPQSDRAYVNDYRNRSLTDQVKRYPKFFTKIEFEIFRHIRNLSVEFQNPITVISGTNKSGKTSILLAIACSHYNFQKKDYSTNTFKRTTWGDVMKFTNHDQQQVDWTYYVSYRNGKFQAATMCKFTRLVTNTWCHQVNRGGKRAPLSSGAQLG